MQRPRPVTEDDALEALSIEQLERLHAALMVFSSMDPSEVGAYVRKVIEAA